MSRILSHPFRLAPNGSVATVEQVSDAANAEQVAVLVLTNLGERPLAPGFGITDPAFVGVEPTEVLAGLAEYGPPVTIASLELRQCDEVHQDVVVTFE